VAGALACFPAGQGTPFVRASSVPLRNGGSAWILNGSPVPPTMGSVRNSIEWVIEDVQAYAEAAQRLAERLLQQAEWATDDIARLRSGMSVTDSCGATKSAERSRSLTRIMAEFEASRRAIRASTVLALLDEGMSVTDIGKVFGVSRQLANRLVKDARSTDRTLAASV